MQGDAKILHDAILECIRTSPNAFLMTREEFNGKSSDYWQHEVRAATWAVIERGAEVIGVAVARYPDRDADADVDPDRARFIESAWISPEFRGSRMGERLIKFLFEGERRKHPEVDQFWLWVFDDNFSAIRLYERIGFKYTNTSKKHEPSGRTELRYQYTLNSGSTEPREAEVAANEIEREDGLRLLNVTYRILREKVA